MSVFRGQVRPPSAPRPRTARIALIVLAVVVLAAGVTVWVVRVYDGGDDHLPSPVALPWPVQGQAAVEVEGIGSLGTVGAQDPVPIASVAKVMTAYVILRDHPLANDEAGPEITVDQEAEDEAAADGESTVPLRAGRTQTERQLLELMLVPSGNNAARLLARWDSGSEPAFVTKMNRAATGLDMTRTRYTGASGVEDTTTSTASDQLRLAKAAMNDAVFRAIVAEGSVVVPGVPGRFTNTNTLLGSDEVVGIKTGSTTAAGGALMWAARPVNATGSGLILGVVLHQDAGTTPAAGLAAVLAASRTLVAGVQEYLGGGAPESESPRFSRPAASRCCARPPRPPGSG